MIIPEFEPCDVQHLGAVSTILILCALGVLAEAALVLMLKGWECLLAIREHRLRDMLRRRP